MFNDTNNNENIEVLDTKEENYEEEIINNSEIKDEEVEINIPGKSKRLFKGNFSNKFKDLKVKYKKDPKKYLVMASALLLMFSALIGSSYAYLTYVAKTNNSVTITAGQLSLIFQNEQNVISLVNAVPLSDSDGLAQSEEYTFKIKNNGTLSAGYTIILNDICTPSATIDTCIPDDYVKVGIKEENGNYKVLAKKDNKYILETGVIGINAVRSYSMKIWLDYATPNTYNAKNGQNMVYKGKLSIEYEQGKGYSVQTVVDGGTTSENAKNVAPGDNVTFTVTPTDSSSESIVSCTNGQTGTYANNTLTVTNVTSDTTCTVTFNTFKTTLFTDGTLIINEKGTDRTSNITKHGAVTNEYAAYSANNPYSFSDLGSGQPWSGQKENITRIEIGTRISPYSTKAWFYNLTNLREGDFTNLDTSNVSDAKNMFNNAGSNSSVTSFALTGLNTWNMSKLSDADNMFNRAGYNATTWSIGDLSGWGITRKATNTSYMFSSAGNNATTFDLGNLDDWDVSGVNDIDNMFYHAGYNATTWNIGDLSRWKTSTARIMTSMFSGAGNHATTWSIGDLSNWDVSRATNMGYMFSDAGNNSAGFNLGNLENWNTSNVTTMSGMFSGAGGNSSTWNIGDLSAWNTSNVTNMSYMFMGIGKSDLTSTCNSIGTLKVYADNISYMFRYAYCFKGTLNIYSNPSTYTDAFGESVYTNDSLITVNYSSSTANIDDIIATKWPNSNVVKGSQLD